MRLVIAGDLHHYRRHILTRHDDEPPRCHFVTAGGGGAFLHPTHAWIDVDARQRGPERPDKTWLKLVKAFPSKRRSRKMTLGLFWFAFTNRWFMAASAAIYGLIALAFLLSIRVLPVPSPHAAFWDRMQWSAALSPAVIGWLAIMLAGFVASTDTSVRWYRWVGGLTHGSVHIAASLTIPCLLMVAFAENIAHDALWLLPALLASVALGALAGAVIMGLYLLGSLLIFGRHRNEAFSALRIEGYKNFLRLKMTAKGIDFIAFGIRRVPEWDVDRSGTVLRRRILPSKPIAPGDAEHPFVIERFTVTPTPAPK